jgi:hypothetical protein
MATNFALLEIGDACLMKTLIKILRICVLGGVI